MKIIKPLPDDRTEGEDEGHTYSCLCCFLLTPSGVDTRCVGFKLKSAVLGLQTISQFDSFVCLRDVCVEEDLTTQPTYKDLLTLMRFVQQLRHFGCTVFRKQVPANSGFMRIRNNSNTVWTLATVFLWLI